MAQLHKAVVEHRTYQTVDITVTQIFFAILFVVGCCLALLVEMTEHDGLFLVLLDVNNHLLIVVNGIVDTLSRIFRHRNG